MFAGVTSIMLNEEERTIEGISSKEGEEVRVGEELSDGHRKYDLWSGWNIRKYGFKQH